MLLFNIVCGKRNHLDKSLLILPSLIGYQILKMITSIGSFILLNTQKASNPLPFEYISDTLEWNFSNTLQLLTICRQPFQSQIFLWNRNQWDKDDTSCCIPASVRLLLNPCLDIKWRHNLISVIGLVKLVNHKSSIGGFVHYLRMSHCSAIGLITYLG